MPFETPAQAEQRRSEKAERAQEIARRRRRREELVQVRVLTALSTQFVRGFEELGALLRCSERLAQDIAKRPGFPRPAVTGDRMLLWRTERVIEWIESQAEPAAQRVAGTDR